MAEGDVRAGHVEEAVEQREPRERQYACSACKVRKPRDDYWLEDFDNRAITKRLVCKVCRPTPPAQPQQQHHQKGQARSKSAGAVLSHASEGTQGQISPTYGV